MKQSYILVIINRHREYLHEDARFSCDTCDYETRQLIIIKQHKEITNEFVRYASVSWYYKATQKSDLSKQKSLFMKVSDILVIVAIVM